jgi:hypothetical protein
MQAYRSKRLIHPEIRITYVTEAFDRKEGLSTVIFEPARVNFVVESEKSFEVVVTRRRKEQGVIFRISEGMRMKFRIRTKE